MELLERIKQNARKYEQRIVLPEGYEERTIRAADIAIEEGLAQIILIGDPAEIKEHAERLGLKNISKASVIDPHSHEKKEHYSRLALLQPQRSHRQQPSPARP